MRQSDEVMATHTKDQLSEAALRVYEVEMLVVTTGRLFGAPGPRDQPECNAYLESMLLAHAPGISSSSSSAGPARCLTPAHSTCPDFAPDWEPDPEIAERVRGYLPIIDQQVSHLTWQRVVGDKSEWRLWDLRGALVADANDRRGRWIRSAGPYSVSNPGPGAQLARRVGDTSVDAVGHARRDDDVAVACQGHVGGVVPRLR